MSPFDGAEAIDWLHRVDANWQEHGYGRVATTDSATARPLGRTGLMYLPQFTEGGQKHSGQGSREEKRNRAPDASRQDS